MSPDPVNSQKAENYFVLGGFSSVPECGFLQERNAFSGILSGRAFRKLRLCYGSAFYRGTTEQDEQGGYHLPDENHAGALSETLSAFETTKVIEYKLTGADRNCPDCNTKYKVVTKETVKRLKLVPARFEVAEEVTYVYSCPKCGAVKRPEKAPSLLKGSVATPSLAAGIMNAKYVGGMPLARQEREFARYDLNLSTKTMANWIIQCADR